MIDRERLKAILVKYKKEFASTWWKDEKYKWKAVKTFNKYWNEDADDFATMLSNSLTRTHNLLASYRNFPREMIKELATIAPEEVRDLFKALYDESRDVVERILEFKDNAIQLKEKYKPEARQHYQTENAISTYLWLRFPDKYYIYKVGEVQNVAKQLGSDYTFTRGAYSDNLRNCYSLYDEICEFLHSDKELIGIFNQQLDEDCYPDPEYKTLTIDVGFYISRKLETTSVPSIPSNKDISKKYSKEDFLREVFMSGVEYDKVAAVLKNKKNLILQGAPGVGKTFAAKRLAYSIMGECNDSRIEFVQFHQSYSYEDFMLGYKPSESGFELRQGIFYTFCLKAANEPDKDFFFIIDEINRGNMSKIFGELLMLIEKDYRGKKTTLAYDGRQFSVPENLHIIGMMNTADRSLAMIDYALRRRFSFYEMTPSFDSDGFRQYKKNLGNEKFNQLIEKVKELNNFIVNDNALGKGFCIGHSYFCNWEKDECTVEKMRQVVDFDILPMLEEYWFDDASKVERWQSTLRAILE